jgi:hypothetical protein
VVKTIPVGCKKTFKFHLPGAYSGPGPPGLSQGILALLSLSEEPAGAVHTGSARSCREAQKGGAFKVEKGGAKARRRALS